MMSQQIALSAVVSFLLLLQLATVCNGRATKTSTNEDALESLAKRLESLIAEKEHEAREDLNDELDEQEEAEIEKSHIHSKLYDSRDGGLTADQINKVIGMHNKMRTGEGASDMQRLSYNSKLAQLAQSWADGCSWAHRQHGSFAPADYGFSSVGENIWASTDSSKTLPDAPIQDWFNEKPYYVFGTGECTKEPCGHYTQVVWSSTREIGCGLAKCGTLQNTPYKNAYYFVCNYGPGGNAYQKKPFAPGTACSACSTGKFFCTNGLCDDSCSSPSSGGQCQCKANCVHGTQTSECKCKCNDDYTGVSCNEKCADKNSQCGANPGWPEMFCHKETFGGMMYDTVNAECPKMCKKCGTSKRSDNEHTLLEYLERLAKEKK